MSIEELVKASRPYSGRKYENMTVLQRLRCDLLAEAADYDHRHMHTRDQQKADREIADELVTVAQDYAWRYANHKRLALLDTLIEQISDGRLLQKDSIIAIVEAHKKSIQSDLKEYQRQFKNMELM